MWTVIRVCLICALHYVVLVKQLVTCCRAFPLGYIGSRGVGALNKVLYEEVPPDVQPLTLL